MFTRAIRRSFEHEEGQALVIACLMMLVLSIAVLTTVNFGHTVNERVRLQNTADASAYSMAAMEARAFNFYAFVNRAQVSHYVAAMVWMSIDSFVFFAEAYVTDLYGLIKTIVASVTDPKIRALLDVLIPGMGEILQGLQTVVDGLGTVPILLQANVRASGIDEKIGRGIIPAHVDLNMALAGMSQAVIASTLPHVASTESKTLGGGTLALNDPNLGDIQVSQQAVNVVNGCLLDRAHFKEANGTAEKFGPPTEALAHKSVREDDKIARAKRTMGQISNASRFACDSNDANGCPDDFVTNRSAGKYLKMVTVLKGFNVMPILNSLTNPKSSPKWGQTGMLSYNLARGGVKAEAVMPAYNKGKCSYPPSSDATRETEQNLIRAPLGKVLPNHPVGVLGQGDNLGADDVYAINLGLSAGHKVLPFFCGANMDWRRCWGEPRICDPKKDLGNTGACISKSNEQRDPRYMLKSSVWALNDDDREKGGVHWRVLTASEINLADGSDESQKDLAAGAVPTGDPKQADAKKYGLIAYGQGCAKFLFGGLLTVYVAAIRPWTAKTSPADNNHHWPGLAPFPHFEPGQFAEACQDNSELSSSLAHAAPRTMDFNQPSSFMVLNKTPRQLRNPFGDDTGASHNDPALLNKSGSVTFIFGAGVGQSLSLEDNKVQFMGRDGLNVVSRALTYYHRPGDWVEQPNFFNPYWRPRLASVWQGREQLPLVQQYVDTLPDVFKKSPQKVLTH